MRYTDPSGHGIYSGDDYDPDNLTENQQSLFIRLPRNYNPLRAVEYALTRTSKTYSDEYPEAYPQNLCTIFVSDIVTTESGGGWYPKVGQSEYTRESASFSNTVYFLRFMEAQPDVHIIYGDFDEDFTASIFQVGDVVLIDQFAEDDYEYNHAVFVTDVNMTDDIVWVLELSGSSKEQIGRDFTDTNNPIQRFAIVRFDELINQRER